MFNFDYGTRLDQLDYERFGVTERWCLNDTIMLLTCFEMETRGFFSQSESQVKYDKIFDKYKDVLSDCLFKCKFEYENGCTPDSQLAATIEHYGVIGFDFDRANFDRDMFLDYVESSPQFKVDVVKLRRFISGDEYPVEHVVKEPSAKEVVVEKQVVRTGVNSDATTSAGSENVGASEDPTQVSDENAYCFERVGSSWRIKFQDVELRGVKTIVGLDVIKILLQNPNEKISVLQLQSITATKDDEEGSPDKGRGQRKTPEGDYSDRSNDDWGYSDGSDDLGSNDPESNELGYGRCLSVAWEPSDEAAIQAYRKHIAEIEEQLRVARGGSVVNRSKIERLQKEKEAIEAHLAESTRKPKDPELEKNRKKVYKNITEAIAKISKLEEMAGYHDKLMSKHLSRHIQKGTNCTYQIEESVLPKWRF